MSTDMHSHRNIATSPGLQLLQGSGKRKNPAALVTPSLDFLQNEPRMIK